MVNIKQHKYTYKLQNEIWPKLMFKLIGHFFQRIVKIHERVMIGAKDESCAGSFTNKNRVNRFLFYKLFSSFEDSDEWARWWTGTMLMMIFVELRIWFFHFVVGDFLFVVCLFTYRDTVDENCRFFLFDACNTFTQPQWIPRSRQHYLHTSKFPSRIKN